MRHRCSMKPLNWSSSPWSRGTLHRQQRRNSNRPLQLGRSRAQCFGTEKAFCLWTSCLKAPQSTQMPVAAHFKNCDARSRISDVAYLAGVLWWFITTPDHTLQCKISTWHLAGNNLVIPPKAQTYRQVTFICFCILNPSLLAGGSKKTMRSKKPLPRALHSRRHHSTMKGYKNCCSTMTTASTMVEPILKCSVQFAHQMAMYKVCNIFLFFS